ncbi:hypothetical protein [Blastococcus sp. LR1]|uniref:hypothetical protein n=1 Tax=Blastococcus sp. LR1 TaxID=2877000 RepID=UPI001CCA24C9|nr:hypothetical protein [Blastococcus sp. LR1]MCA0144870.1 hypothetical protein [Blastococcus sp. LR1]
MDLTEAAQRIFKYHWVLILVTTLIGLSIPLLLAQAQDDEYRASARIVMGSADPRDGEEATSQADAALGVATSPGVVGDALTETGVQRDADEVAGRVRVEPVGTSGVLELAVTDPDPAASAALANALADAIVERRAEAVLGDTERLLQATDEQIAELAATVTAIQDEAAAAARQESRAIALGLAPDSTLDAIELRNDQAVDQLNRAQDQRQLLAQTLAETVRPDVIDRAPEQGTLVDASVPARLAVGALLGLLLGIALAAALEAWRPTLNGHTLARHFGVPLLGHLPRLPGRGAGIDDPRLTTYVSLAADGAGVRSYELVQVGPKTDVSPLAEALARGDGNHDVLPAEESASNGTLALSTRSHGGAGVIVVAPERTRSTWLEDLERHVQLTRQPVIGVVTYGKRAADGSGTAGEDAPRTGANGGAKVNGGAKGRGGTKADGGGTGRSEPGTKRNATSSAATKS